MIQGTWITNRFRTSRVPSFIIGWLQLKHLLKKNHPLKAWVLMKIRSNFDDLSSYCFLSWVVGFKPPKQSWFWRCWHTCICEDHWPISLPETKPASLPTPENWCQRETMETIRLLLFWGKRPIFSGASLLLALGRVTTKKDNWVVATQICFIFTPKLGKMNPFWRAYFFRWVETQKPPTRWYLAGPPLVWINHFNYRLCLLMNAAIHNPELPRLRVFPHFANV